MQVLLLLRGMRRLSRLQLNVAPDVCGVSVIGDFGRHGDIDAKLGIVPRGVEDVTVRCAGGQSGHDEGVRGVKRRFEGAVADADTQDKENVARRCFTRVCAWCWDVEGDVFERELAGEGPA